MTENKLKNIGINNKHITKICQLKKFKIASLKYQSSINIILLPI